MKKQGLTLSVKKTGDTWAKMKNVKNSFGVQNISHLVFKEICSTCKTKKLTKEQIKKYKMTESEIFEKYANLSETELKPKNNKDHYAKNGLMTTVIKQCRGEKKRWKKNRWIQKKNWWFKNLEYEVKAKIRNIFVNEKTVEKCSGNIYEKKKKKGDGREYILFRIDVYFFEYLLAVEIDEKRDTDRDLLFEEKRQEALEKKLCCKFIRINTNKRCNEDIEIGRIQTFISKFNNWKLKKNETE